MCQRAGRGTHGYCNGVIFTRPGVLVFAGGNCGRRIVLTPQIRCSGCCIHWFWPRKEAFCSMLRARYGMEKHFYSRVFPEPARPRSFDLRQTTLFYSQTRFRMCAALQAGSVLSGHPFLATSARTGATFPPRLRQHSCSRRDPATKFGNSPRSRLSAA